MVGLGLTVTVLTELGPSPRFTLFGYNLGRLTGFRCAIQAQHFQRNRRAGFFDWLTILIDHRPHTTKVGTGQQHVTDLQLTTLNQNGSNGTATFLDTGFNDHTGC